MILIVDDMEINREILAGILGDEYTVITAENGEQAMEMIAQYREKIRMILLDLVMPVMDGYAVLQKMKEQSLISRIPVLIITAENSVATERVCFDYGVSDFIRKPFDNILIKKRVKNVIELFRHKNELEELVAEQTDTMKKQYQLLQQQAEMLRKNNEKIMDILGTVVEYRNPESGEHIQRVKDFSRILAEEMMKDCPEYGLTPEMVDIIASASALHDVGKIAIPDSILMKPGRLTADEFEYMKTHTTKGSEILNTISGTWDDSYDRVSYEICRYHHERYDGKGYPEGLSGEEIPVSAQIVSIADVYDALVSERVYKNAYTREEAFHMIMTGECGTFSPKLLECFRRVKSKFEQMADSTQ